MQLTIDYEPHSKLAYDIHKCPARFRVISAGRRWGKTNLCAIEAFQMGQDVLRAKARRSRGWWVAPTFDITQEGIRYIREYLGSLIYKQIEGRIIFRDGNEIEFKSANSKDRSLRGSGLDFVIVDEAAKVPEQAWQQGLRLTISDRKGRAIFISTPCGINWFYTIFNKGTRNLDSEWASWTAPSSSNPYFPKDEFILLKKELPEDVFRQEVMAQFIEGGGLVFRSISQCVEGELEEPRLGARYSMGVDIARTQDFTVITVIDVERRHVVAFERFNQLDWPFQKDKIKFYAKKYNDAIVMIDSTGIGDVVHSDLLQSGVRASGYKFTNESKAQLVNLARLATEERLVTFPDIPQLIHEMRIFSCDITTSGKIRYAAPEGEGNHDDCVFSFCLALQPMKNDLHTKKLIVPVKRPLDFDPKYEYRKQKIKEMIELPKHKNMTEQIVSIF